jgi:Tol biopolymer transport system component
VLHVVPGSISRAGDLIAVVNAYSPDVVLVAPRAGTMQRITPAVDDAGKGFGSVAVSPDGTRVAVTSTYNGGTPQGVVPAELADYCEGPPEMAGTGNRQERTSEKERRSS